MAMSAAQRVRGSAKMIEDYKLIIAILGFFLFLLFLNWI